MNKCIEHKFTQLGNICCNDLFLPFTPRIRRAVY